jgi:hypothetical protein
MALSFKSSCRDVIDFRKYWETRPAGVIFDGVKRHLKLNCWILKIINL